jgi:flagellar hook-length control protein FliK
LLADSNATVTDSRLASDLPTVRLAAGPHLAANQANANMASLSAEGRLINQLLHIIQEAQSPLSVQGKKPILASPPTPDNSDQAAVALKNTLDQSGLFYESHMVEWVNNQRPLTELMKEPQAQLASPQQTTGAPSAPPSSTPDSFNSDLAQIVNQQLNLLEQNKIVWQGEVWPGQQMAWEVSEETARRGGQEETGEANSVWCSDLRLDLPSLGTVAARINWSGGHVQIQVRTEHEPVASSLRAHGVQLASALDSAGSKLDALQVQVEGAA